MRGSGASLLCNPSFVRIPFKAAWPDPPQWVALPLRLACRSLSPSPSLSMYCRLAHSLAPGHLANCNFSINSNHLSLTQIAFKLHTQLHNQVTKQGKERGLLLFRVLQLRLLLLLLQLLQLTTFSAEIPKYSARARADKRSESSNGSKQLDML